MVGENSIGMRFAWRSFQTAIRWSGILKDLLFGRASSARFLLGGLPTAVIHFAAVESHGGIVVDLAGVSMSFLLNSGHAVVAQPHSS